MFLFRDRISQLNIAYLVMTDCKTQEKISLFKHVLREIAMVFRLKVALNLVSHYFVFYVILLGMFKHIQYMQSSSLIFRKCSKYFKCFKLLPTTLEQKRKLWLWSIWFQIVNSVSCLSSKKNVHCYNS